MCGRYALALRPSQVRRMLQDDDMPVWDAPADEDDGPGVPRQSYNFAPGYHGIVYRADVPDWGAGPRQGHKSKGAKATDSDAAANEPETAEGTGEAEASNIVTISTTSTTSTTTTTTGGEKGETHYKLQSMKWGLIPFWTKRNPDYAAVLKTINCRDDSLAQAGGMWSSMKGRKRCVVVAQGFYEWLKSGKEKVPHFVRRKDGRLMFFAGLWDCVKYEDDNDNGDDDQKHYTYTIITTDSNKQLRFLHDRMPVILEPASDRMRTWLDPSRYEWSKDLQDTLCPFDGELEVYPVSKEVGKVGNNSPSFIIPIASRENKSNIANFFANAQAKKENAKRDKGDDVEAKEKGSLAVKEAQTVDDFTSKVDDGGMGLSPAAAAGAAGAKRKGDGGLEEDEGPPKKKEPALSPAKVKTSSPSPSKSAAKGPRTTSATSNGTKSPAKGKQGGTQKITKFFGNSA